MIAALYSKDTAERAAFLRDFAAGANGPVIHLYPKNRDKKVPALPGVYSVTYEDVTQRDPWLHVNSLLGPRTTVIFENCARYPKATAPKSRALRRLSMQIERKALVDIVPFTIDIQFLYTPLSYLSRSILGYAHYYAFRENYQEMDDDGVVRNAHDYDVLAAKMAPVCRISYPAFLCPNRTVVHCPLTADEHGAYAERKAELFSKEKSPQRIITRLADTTHAMETRTQALLELLATLDGEAIAFCNLASYARRAQAAAKSAGFRRFRATSYQLGAQEELPEHVIYLESPIVNSYYLLDIEANIEPGSHVWHFKSDAKVDDYLYGLINHELTQIDGLTRELYRVSSEGTEAEGQKDLPQEERA